MVCYLHPCTSEGDTWLAYKHTCEVHKLIYDSPSIVVVGMGLQIVEKCHSIIFHVDLALFESKAQNMSNFVKSPLKLA